MQPFQLPSPWTPIVLRNRYNVLLGVVVLHLVALGLDLPWPGTDLINLGVTLIAAGLLRMITRRDRDFWILVGLGTAGPILNLVLPWGSAPLPLDLLKVAFWALAPAFLAQRTFITIYDSDAITHAEIAGAIAVYLLLALIFANIFEAIYTVNPQAIRFGENFATGSIGFGEVLYFSFITLSTVGFGDVAPAHLAARIVVVLESVAGIMYMAILVARFVSLHSADRFHQRRGDLPRD